MTESILYPPKNCRHKNIAALAGIALCLLLSLFIPQPGFAREDLDYDEISIFINVQGVGSVEVPAVIRNEIAYLAVADVFNFLKIKSNLSPGLDSVSGFFITPQATFLIDKTHNRILYKEKVFNLKPDDIIQTETNLYLRLDYFGQVFGLECTFSFRSLSVTLNTMLELPVIREMRQEVMRTNISRLKGELKADTTIERRYPFFRFGFADWSVVATQNLNGQSDTVFDPTQLNPIIIKNMQGQNDTRLNLTLGGVVAGGEANLSLNYNNNTPFTERQQYYQWRFVNNDLHALRQVTAGKIFVQPTSSVYSPVVGVQFTNTPTTYRRSFGTYTLSDHTKPDWMVELYVNNVLVNYTKADASGFFTFEVPLVYGNSEVKLRFYGPWGEERYSEQNINIPFNFLPMHQFEYTVSAGVVEDSINSRFSRASFNYGISRRLTVGGGVEYLSSVTSGKSMPYLNASLRLTSNLLMSGEYTYGVRSKSVISYHLPSNLQVEVNYTRYKKGQKAINNTYLEERKAVISFPFRTKKFTAFSRFTLYQIILPSSKYTTAEGMLSGVIFGINTNFTTYALFTGSAKPYIYSNLSMVFRLPAKFVFTPQAQYEYNEKKIIGMKGELGKYLSARCFLNVFYENNFKSQFQSVGIGLRYDFSFAQMGFSARQSAHTSTLVQSARGSVMYDGKTDYLGFNSRTNVGRGGIIILPFLDLNCNGMHDKDEPKVAGLKVQINSGRIQNNKADTTIRIFDLEAYSNYTIRLNSDFENIAWQIRKRTINIAIDPNQFKLIEVPVTVMGEISGMVYLKENNNKKEQGRIIVQFYRSDSTLAGQTLSEADGFFNFAGLSPGSYTARIDADQMQKLHLTSLPASIPFTISTSQEGDVVDNVEFVLQSTQNP